MATPQTKRLLIARLNGFTAYIHKYSQPSLKRLSDPINVVRGDGSNKVDKLHDPAVTEEPVTLEVIVEKSRAFMAEARALFLQHKQDPSVAGALVLQSLKDNGAVEDVMTLPRAVIQEIRMPDGDVQTHGEAIAQVVVCPEDAF